MAQSSADVVGFWNVDDVRNGDALLDGVRLMRRGAEVVYFPVVEIDYFRRRGRLLERPRFVDAVPSDLDDFTRGMHAGPFFLVSRSAIARIGGFDQQFYMCGDFEWCARAAASGTEFVRSETVGGLFYRGSGALSHDSMERHLAENNVVYLRYGASDKVRPVRESLMAQYRV
jgi:GT2 family glycosyltransferase